jgi:hypothetical protein
MNMHNGQEQNDGLEAPPKLLAALKQLPKEPVFVPQTIDEAIIKAAHQRLGYGDKKKSRWPRLVPWTVAVAGFAAAVLVAYPYAKHFLGFGGSGFERSTRAIRPGSENTGESAVPQSHGLAYVREDLNRDGEVNILDAFMLAKKLQSAPLSDPNLDVNGDGVIDHRDVETIAAHAVSLEKRGRS